MDKLIQKLPKVFTFDVFLAGFYFAYFLVICWVNPIGEFCINDDWSFSKSVKQSLDSGSLKLCGWASMTLIAQVLWGLLWVNFFGFSFTILRISTIVLSFIGIYYIYYWSIHIHKTRKLALISTAIIFFNPLIFSLTFSFMTDIPFMVISIIAIFYLHRFLEDKLWIDFIIGIIFSVIALLIRQYALAIPISFCIAHTIQAKYNWKQLWVGILPFALILLTYLIFKIWFKNTQSNGLYGQKETELIVEIIKYPTGFIVKTFVFSFSYLYYLGIFILPYGIYLFIQSNYNTSQRIIIACSFLFFFAFALYLDLAFSQRIPFRLNGNLIYKWGVGLVAYFSYHPHCLYDETITSIWISRFIGFISSLSLAILFEFYLRSVSYSYKNGNLFLHVLFVSFLSLISVSVPFDRYILLLVVIFVQIIQLNYHSNISEFRLSTFFISLIVFIPLALFGIFGTKSYLEFQRTRIEGVDFLTENLSAPLNIIDGGFEYEGWNFYGTPSWGKNKISYAVDLIHPNGYSILKKYPYKNYLLFKSDTLYILQKD